MILRAGAAKNRKFHDAPSSLSPSSTKINAKFYGVQSLALLSPTFGIIRIVALLMEQCIEVKSDDGGCII